MEPLRFGLGPRIDHKIWGSRTNDSAHVVVDLREFPILQQALYRATRRSSPTPEVGANIDPESRPGSGDADVGNLEANAVGGCVIRLLLARPLRRDALEVEAHLLARLVGEVGRSRANARRQLNAALTRRGPARAVEREHRPRTYGYDIKVLQRVWEVAGRPCGKYLAAVMGPTVTNMEKNTTTGAFGDAATPGLPQGPRQ